MIIFAVLCACICACERKMQTRIFSILALAMTLLCGCKVIDGLIHDDEAVARVGSEKLYLSELQSVIPDGVSPEDSIAIAEQYINTWAKDMLFLALADEHLSKTEKDVTKELDDYRKSLLKYRYEQRYINERLDTVVSQKTVEDYYENHQELFRLDVPIVKVRFLDIMADSPNFETLRKRIGSQKEADLAGIDSLAFSSALKYIDRSENWIDAVSIAREFGMDYADMFSRMKNNYIESAEDRGDVKIAYICDLQRAGTIAPVEYCTERIKDIIIGNRKRELVNALEQELLESGLAQQNFEIY